jgi:CHASE2 domain-containing sensor protein/signal transduction histidine kinase
MTLKLRLIIEWLVIACIASLTILLALQWRGTSSFDHLFYDQLSSIARPAADPDTIIVSIDDASLAKLGKWPWSRDKHAELITKLQSAKPRSILLDILLSEPSDPAHDTALATAMRQGVPVYIPLHFVAPGSDGRDYDVVKPILELAEAAAGVGQVNIEFDDDGVVRAGSLCFSDDKGVSKWPHVVELVWRGGGTPSSAYERGNQCNNSLRIPYARRGGVAEISYADLLAGEVPADLIKGRDVIIGATAVGLGDAYPVPLADGGLLSGAEIMANMLAAIKRDDFIRPVPQPVTILLSLLPIWLLLLGFLRWRPRFALVMSIGLAVLILLGSALLLRLQIWFPPGAAMLGILFVYPLWGWRRLQAMSDFMASEIGDLERDGEILPVPAINDRTSDLVGRQSAVLARAIDHMRDLRRFVSDAMEHLPDPMFVTNNDGVITMANHLTEQRLRRNIVGLELKTLLDEVVQPQYLKPVRAYFDLDSKAMGGTFIRFIARDGRSFVMRSADVLDDSDNVHGRIHYLADISELAKAETEREEALQLLSHDMRAPQSAIISMLPDLRDTDARTRIEGHARRTMQLAQDFVQIARMEEKEFEGTDLLLVELARDVADTLWPLAKERQIEIKVLDREEDAFVFAEADSLSRALTNLVDNAVKHSPDQGTITIEIVRVENNQLEIRVQDQGSGVDIELLPQLFTRFGSGKEGKSRVKSLGLGLAFVRAVAERHQGTVRAENMQSGGACFILTLPEAVEPVTVAVE